MKDTSNNSIGSKIIIIVLALLLAVLAYFSYKNKQDNNESEAILLEEKLNIQSDLDKKIIELETAIANNSSIENELTEARDNIIAFRDSVKNLKTLNSRIIRRYKGKLAVLELANKKLLHVADSLKIANYNIAIERDSAEAVVEQQIATISNKNKQNQSLVEQNEDLNKKINRGSALQVGDVTIVAMRERRSGKLKKTEKARRTDAFRISFIVRKNLIADASKKKAHVVIKDALGTVLSSTETFTEENGGNIPYTDSTSFEYNNEDIEVVIVTTLTEEKLEKGEYYVSIYVDHKLLGSTNIYLK